MRKKEKKIFVLFLVGFIMLMVGMFLFAENSVADMGILGIRIAGFPIMKVVLLLPFLGGIFWLYLSLGAREAKLIIVVGMIILFIAIVRSMQYRFVPFAATEYFAMFLLIAAGMAVILLAMYFRNKDKELFN